MDTLKARNRHSALPGSVGAGGVVYNPWRPTNSTSSILSPAPHRRPNKHENLFGNIYNTSREAFFSAF